MTLAEALVYQREQDEAKRPFYGNPNLAAQGRNVERQRAFPFTPGDGFLRDPQSYKDMAGNLLEMISPPVPTPEEAKAGLGSMRADSQLKGSVMQGYPDAQGLLANQAYDKMGNIAMAGINTWHGSPHRFPPTAKNPLGEFDPMKIGTGEGAQAYGVGAGYLAEAKGTATGFRDALAHKGALDLEYEARKRGIPLNREAQIEFMRQSIPNVSPEKAVRSFQNANIEARNLDQNKLTALFKDYKESKQGSLYKVDLPDEQIAKMLDWDKPLSQQSWYRPVADVVKEYKGAGKDVDAYARLISKANARGGEVTGGQLYEGMLSHFGGSQAKVSAFMREAGIPGIRYLDEGSRNSALAPYWNVIRESDGATVSQKVTNEMPKVPAGFRAEGPIDKRTRNFVVFDPAHMNIIGRE